jgi:hypothetical protein
MPMATMTMWELIFRIATTAVMMWLNMATALRDEGDDRAHKVDDHSGR